jgi:hypothetical protein
MQWAARHSPGGRYLELSAGHAPFIGHAAQVAAAVLELQRELAA